MMVVRALEVLSSEYSDGGFRVVREVHGGWKHGYVSVAALGNCDGEGGVNCAVTQHRANQMWVLVVFKAPFSTAAGDEEDDGGASEVRMGARGRTAMAGLRRKVTGGITGGKIRRYKPLPTLKLCVSQKTITGGIIGGKFRCQRPSTREDLCVCGVGDEHSDGNLR
ncbi:hypothetical protein PIB30_091949 [Stylosanthes scabra]|uniref:Uncharacterized protein n=1 Tax=Stylosanthes scabra TaxID=79078 RepID=A0ABU6YTQ6_9FABA|nr:hypothetical protein [Stylosanthes scabra]